jgi:hypothetical protein
MLYFPPRVLVTVLLFLGTLKIIGTNHMLDALAPGPYAQLFTISAYVSTAVWFAIALWLIAWYSNSLNELRREASAALAVTHWVQSDQEY